MRLPETAFAAVGDNCIDHFMPPVGDCLVGGNAVNVAVQLARLGRSVAYFGAVGEDAEGLAVEAALRRNAVDVAALHRLAGRATARTDIETLADGDRRFVFESFGATGDYRPSGAEIARLSTMSHVHIGWLTGAVALRRALRSSAVVLSQDLSVNNAPGELDPGGLAIAFSSAAPAQGEAESWRLLAGGAAVAVVTLGAAGSLANDGVEIRRAEALPTTVMDTTGAGDAFIAGFLDAHAKRLNLQACLAAGAEQGALACRYRGGFRQEPLQPFVHDRRP